MKLLAFSDLHCDLDGAADLVEKAREADVVIAAGDFAKQHDGLTETIDALKPIGTPTILVPGNNETNAALRAACQGWPAATVLHGETTQIGGTTFFGLGGGTPITPWDWSYDLSEDDAREKLTACPDGAVLVTHSPPKGHVDEGLGSEAILEAIEAHGPRLAVCGHIHSQWGETSEVGQTPIHNLGPSGTTLIA
jgi:Icc-related predicted phosphoesterase